MRVVLGTFACTGIEAFLGRDIAAGVQAALRHYTRRSRVDARGARVLAPLSEPALAGSGADLELSVDPEVEAALEREASASGGMSVDQVVAHAVLVYLADLDRASGPGSRPLTQV